MKRAWQELRPFLQLLNSQRHWLGLGLALSLFCLIAGLGLLGLAGGFLAATALASLSIATIQSFNYYLPAAGVRFFAIARTASRWAERVVSHEATFRVIGEIRVWLYQRLVRLSPKQLTAYHGSDLLNRLTQDIDALNNLYQRLLLPVTAALMSFILLGWVLCSQMLALFWPWLGLFILTFFILPVTAYWQGHKLAPLQVQQQTQLRRDLLDSLDALEDFSLHGPAWQAQRQKVLREDAARITSQIRMQRLGSGLRALQLIGIGTGIWVVLGLAATAHLGPWLAVLVLLVLGSLEAVQTLPQTWLELPGTVASAARLRQLAEQQPDPAYVVSGPQPANTTLQITDLCFAHDPLAPILQSVSLTLKEGEHIALIGPSGGGKTSLLYLFSRLLDPQTGQITLGGIPLPDLDEDCLRRHIACAAQETWMFTAPLADNLRLAKPEARDAELWQVLDLVGLQSTVAAWPAGLQTWIEEHGTSLSGGQRRRLCLAQALLRACPITLLDEPSEGLDPTSEIELIRQVRAHLADKTLLWITHRTRGITEFDRVLLLENGGLTEQI